MWGDSGLTRKDETVCFSFLALLTLKNVDLAGGLSGLSAGLRI